MAKQASTERVWGVVTERPQSTRQVTTEHLATRVLLEERSRELVLNSWVVEKWHSHDLNVL